MNKPIYTEEHSEFSPFDRVALAQLIRRSARPGCRMAEIGSWLGDGSTQTFLEELRSYPGASLVCVDTWQGNLNVQKHQEMVSKYDVFGTFRKNVEMAQSPVKFQVVIGSSVESAALMADGEFDLVFIDADHSYDSVRNDVAAWRPKVRPGGILCGHDCEGRVTRENRRILEQNQDADTIPGIGTRFAELHPGCMLAIDGAFAGAASLWAEGTVKLTDGTPGLSTIWFVPIDEPSRRKPSFSEADFCSVPIAQEYGFLGFNLVSFGGRVYALAESLGVVDLTTMSDEELAGLPNAKTLDEVKYLAALTTVKPLEAAAGPAAAGVQDDAAGNPEIAQLVGAHRGFNLVRYGGKVYGLRQSLGEIDLTDGAEILEQRYGPADFISGETIGEIRVRVDFIESMAARAGEFETKLASLHRDISFASARLTDDLRRATADLQKTAFDLQRTKEDLQKTKDIVLSHSRTWERLAHTWPMRVLLYFSKGK